MLREVAAIPQRSLSVRKQTESPGKCGFLDEYRRWPAAHSPKQTISNSATIRSEADVGSPSAVLFAIDDV
jgi:hypothetical protein